ncbi:Protein of unknown function [Bacillus sp. OV322]|uniref:sporulation inhibitor of replication protein SirA n=1 Tax=Bacillus sp. OV322 TaxID=1882764 RepID=UPI0008E7494C|nr:sporulation inhibitor of replication protein SirA [Bacillus sp. OV322]SFC09752.1 Protein of unknown function [Bacillus sp. OV322]
MRNYRIYLIEDEFAYHFYGREKMFFNLFLEYTNASGEKKSILQKQIEYVTKTIPEKQLQSEIKNKTTKKNNITSQNGVYLLDNTRGFSKAALIIHVDYLALKADGNFEAETAFFECIRKCDSNFLALDFDNNRYGWLKPIKERKFV